VQDIRWKTFWVGIGLVAISVAIWAVAGATPALLFLCLSLIVYIASHIYWIHQLYTWLQVPSLNNIPEGRGIWENVFSALFQQQRKNYRAEAELESALEGFKRATNALPDGIVVLNHRNEIEWCNPPAELLLGLELYKDINQPVQNLVRYGEFIHYLSSQDYKEPVVVKSIRNAESTLQIQLIVFGTAQKLLICRDISVQEKIDTMRRDFIANVSHELRTPLTVVGGFLETMIDSQDTVTENTKHYFDMMITQTNRMRLIIEDLLTLSKMESNNEAPERTTINMQKTLSMIKRDANALSKGQHQITLEAKEGVDIKGSQDELISAFTNLASNAIRYTPDGGPIHLSWDLNSNGQAIFSVKDSGIGIEEQHIDRLTERFYRVDNSRSRDTGGTGLGLAIVKHILNRHKARLAITSTIGEGSTFSIIFPESRVSIDQSKVTA